jgi:hypothetical protein
VQNTVNPIAPLSVSDAIMTIAGIVAFIVAVGVWRRKHFAASITSERYFLIGSDALARLCAVLAAIFLVGFVGLVLLHVQTAFWFIWEVFFFLGGFAIIWVLPALVIGFAGWGIAGRFLAHYDHRATRAVFLCVGSLLVALFLFYALIFGLSAASAKA